MDIAEKDREAVSNLVFAIFRANGAVIARGDKMVGDLKLTASLWQVLAALDQSPVPLTVAQVARAMGLTRQSVQRTADLLASRGLVAFADNPAHKRASLVCLTDEGRRASVAAHARELPSIAGVLSCLDTARIAQAAEVLAILADELTRQTTSAPDSTHG